MKHILLFYIYIYIYVHANGLNNIGFLYYKKSPRNIVKLLKHKKIY